MKTLVLTLIISNLSFATCMMTRTLCTTNAQFENSYEIRKVSCSPPGGPVHRTTYFSVYNSLVGKKPLIAKKFNTTRDNYFEAKIETIGKTHFLSIDDRSLVTQTNINISTDANNPKELYGYRCKDMIR
jgi:hypothetical protein